MPSDGEAQEREKTEQMTKALVSSFLQQAIDYPIRPSLKTWQSSNSFSTEPSILSDRAGKVTPW